MLNFPHEQRSMSLKKDDLWFTKIASKTFHTKKSHNNSYEIWSHKITNFSRRIYSCFMNSWGVIWTGQCSSHFAQDMHNHLHREDVRLISLSIYCCHPVRSIVLNKHAVTVLHIMWAIASPPRSGVLCHWILWCKWFILDHYERLLTLFLVEYYCPAILPCTKVHVYVHIKGKPIWYIIYQDVCT